MHIRIINGIIKDIWESSGIIIESEESKHTFENACIYPGFTDTHGHVFGLGTTLTSPGLYNAVSLEECLSIISKSSPNRGDWLVGYGWNEENWICGSYPDKKYLDSLFPDNPVVMFRVDGHALWVNSKALQAAGIGSDYNCPAGGEVKVDKSGIPTGILVDNAIYPVTNAIPWYSDSQAKEIIRQSVAELASKGITEVHDMDVSPDLIRIYKELDDGGNLPIRLQSFIQAQQDEYLQAAGEPYIGRNFNVIGLKFYADGALGSRGAAMLTDYADCPGHKGLVLIGHEELSRKMAKGIKAGFAIAVHAIGDAANRMVLGVYSAIRNSGSVNDEIILRVEHAQHIHPDDLEKFGKYNIFAAVQPVHCTSDAKMARKRLGLSNTRHYPWKSLLDAGAIMGGGSDFPIESHNPLAGLDAFVNRIPFGENESWMPGECIDFNQALDSYTVNAHVIAGQMNRGKIESGCEADFVILDRDLSIDKTKITDAKVLATFCRGKQVFKA